MNQAVDPIANPSAYQQSLLAALGGDDPAVAQATTPAAFRALVALIFRLAAGHDRVHLGQARRTLEQVRGSG